MNDVAFWSTLVAGQVWAANATTWYDLAMSGVWLCIALVCLLLQRRS